MKKLWTYTAVFLFGCTPSAFADNFSPQLNGIISFEIQNDWTYESDDPDLEVNSLYTTIEPYFILSLNDHLAFEAALVFEPVQDPDAGEDSEFDNEGLYAQELKFTYTGERLGLFIGKYNPTFGTAWDLAPGIYGSDFAEDYELTERLGFGGSYVFEALDVGTHTITANSFFTDTSILSDSTITRRGRTDKNDGGPGNTEDLSSLSVTLDSENPVGIEGLNTHLGLLHQAEGDADEGSGDQNGVVLGANYTMELSDTYELTGLAEWASISNTEGNDDTRYLTTSLVLNIDDNWNVAASYTGRTTNIEDEGDMDDNLFQLSAGYAFENGFTVDAGYRWAEEDNVESNGVGALIAYSYEF